MYKGAIFVDKNHHSTAESFKRYLVQLSVSLFVKMKVAFVLALCLFVGTCVHSSPLDLSSQDVSEVIGEGWGAGKSEDAITKVTPVDIDMFGHG